MGHPVENGKICVKNPKDDTRVSKAFVDGFGWNVDISIRIQEVMRRHPDAVFIGKKYKLIRIISKSFFII